MRIQIIKPIALLPNTKIIAISVPRHKHDMDALALALTLDQEQEQKGHSDQIGTVRLVDDLKTKL